MSGKYNSTGLLTNSGSNQLEIDFYLNKKINEITIHVIPLSTNNIFREFQKIGSYLKAIIPTTFTKSFTHIAIQLDLENSNDILIIEYGQYFTKDSTLKQSGMISSNSSYSFKEPRENKNENTYYYINKDGARITIFKYEKLKELDDYDENNFSKLTSDLIACQYYGILYEEYGDIKSKGFDTLFRRVDCDSQNKITVNELIENFKGEEWEAKNYNVLSHNCQHFAAKVIKILKAVRKNERDKIRVQEKMNLPDCIIKELWHNEPLSLTNTLGRIPILGFFHDCFF